MANTKLKEYGDEVVLLFCDQIHAKKLDRKKLCNVEPDIIALKGNTLILGEFTFSGFMGKKAGIPRKLSDCYAKLDILRHEKSKIRQELKIEFDRIEIYFVTIEGTIYQPSTDNSFRKKLFSERGLQYMAIPVPTEFRKKIERELSKSRYEIQPNNNSHQSI